MDPLNILLLCNRPVRGADAATVTDHLNAFGRFSRHNVFELSFIRELPSRVQLERFDAIVIHYSTALGYYADHYINDAARDKVRNFPGLKVVFVQDEYRAIDQLNRLLRHLAIDVLYTCVPTPEIGKVYPESALPGVTKINNLTGYVPDALMARRVAPIAERPIDVGYRARRMPFWLGALGQEKSGIAESFLRQAGNSGLRLDISCEEADRLYGSRWTAFVGSCKAMLGVESGASVFDFTGELQRNVDQYVEAHPGASFEEVQSRYLAAHEGRIRLNQISPRCFEAIALRTALVLYRGDYSGILKPGRHYIPLEKDFSNIAGVLDALRDTAGLQRMVDCAYEEIARDPGYSYPAFVSQFDEVVAREHAARARVRAAQPYDRRAFRRALIASPAYAWKRTTSYVLQKLVLGTPLRPLVMRIWGRMPLTLRGGIRPLLRLIGR